MIAAALLVSTAVLAPTVGTDGASVHAALSTATESRA
jgi:hypothetical protein